MNTEKYIAIPGQEGGLRLESRILEEKIQEAVARGYRYLKIEAKGQHGIGGRLWKAGKEKLYLKIDGHSGQRTGSFGFPNTCIEIFGPVSDDVGWLNAGAQIVVHGNAGNGAANGMAQGKIYIGGNIGARGMTMTKHNPRFDPPEVWILGSVGDYFGEFMAGGISVICGHKPQNRDNVLGYRPFVGMVGGKAFFRGSHKGYSKADAKIIPITDTDWKWFEDNLALFLKRIDRFELFDRLSDRDDWQLLVALTPLEKKGSKLRSMTRFRTEVWDKELGQGGLIGDLTDLDMSRIPLITTGNMRRFRPVWENGKYLAPCHASCPTGIPVQERWTMIREGRLDEAMDLALIYTPFPATVCGYLCPNLCMQSCTRQASLMAPIDVTLLGKASVDAKIPELPPETGKKIAVIGGGPGGISVAWQLRQKGHMAVVYDMAKSLGGKINIIPESRIPAEVVTAELERAAEIIPHVHLGQRLDRNGMDRLMKDFDFIVIAAGAQKPRTLSVPGKELMITALDFLNKANTGDIKPGKKVVVIGAGNVGCDVAVEAHRLGAEDITLIDVQEPASFGKEREHAEACGAAFRWPCFTKEVTGEGIVLNTGELISADTVVISIGDVPDLGFLPEQVELEGGFIKVDVFNRTTVPKIFAIGDAVKPGLLTEAIGAGCKAAKAIDEILETGAPIDDTCEMIDIDRVSVEYFDPKITIFDGIDNCGSQCSSCGSCRDCGICVNICPQSAISRRELQDHDYEYIVDGERCIACGFCEGACPCGIWHIIENEAIG